MELPGSEALARAIAAANVAASSLAIAQAACAAVPVACQAVPETAAAAERAQSASDDAHAATTVADIESAADLAEAAAYDAEAAAAEAERLAASEPPDDGDPPPDRCESESPPDDCANFELPIPEGDAGTAAALANAIAAANAAASSLADAQAACAAVPAACQAAQEAADAAAWAQSARDDAEAAAEAADPQWHELLYSAADLAQAAAHAAQEAAVEAERLAASEPPPVDGDPPPVDNVNWPEWPIDPVAARPMVGGLDIEDMSSDTILAHLDAVANLETPHPYSDVLNTGNMSWWHLPNVEFSPVMRSAGNIPLFQARTSDQNFPDTSEAPDGFIGYGGWMDHSYFIMGLSTSHSSEWVFYDPDKPYNTTSDGFAYGVYDYPDDFFKVDMHWLGAVIGTDKTLAIPNFVQGTVHMTIRDDRSTRHSDGSRFQQSHQPDDRLHLPPHGMGQGLGIRSLLR